MTTRRPRRPVVPSTPVKPVEEEEVPSVEISNEEKEIAEFLDFAAEELFDVINDMETIEKFVVLPPAPPVGFAQEIPKSLPRYVERKNNRTQYRRG